MNIIEYYYNGNYRAKLFFNNEKYILERTNSITHKTYQVLFKTKQHARNFLKTKNYKIFRIILNNE